MRIWLTNADPPQRSVELSYDPSADDWAATISLNTRDFGPLLHAPSIPRVSDIERGLFCEYWCHAAMKWDIIIKSDSLQQLHSGSSPWRGTKTEKSQGIPEAPSVGNNTLAKDTFLSTLTEAAAEFVPE